MQHGIWIARPIEGTARVEIFDGKGELICVTDDRHAADIVDAYRAVQTIHAILDEEGEEWDSETTSAVAEVITGLGFTIRDPNDAPYGGWDHDGAVT